MKELEVIKERAGKATSGPWWYVLGSLIWTGESKLFAQICGSKSPQREYDMDFICHSRTDVPKLVEIAELAIESFEFDKAQYAHNTAEYAYYQQKIDRIEAILEGK